MITKSAVGGPPDDWYKYRVYNTETGEEVRYCLEVDTVKGEAVVYVQDSSGELLLDESREQILTECIRGSFELRRVRP